jgi:recombinational DNA repair protein (RecF pathway)
MLAFDKAWHILKEEGFGIDQFSVCKECGNKIPNKYYESNLSQFNRHRCPHCGA